MVIEMVDVGVIIGVCGHTRVQCVALMCAPACTVGRAFSKWYLDVDGGAGTQYRHTILK